MTRTKHTRATAASKADEPALTVDQSASADLLELMMHLAEATPPSTADALQSSPLPLVLVGARERALRMAEYLQGAARVIGKSATRAERANALRVAAKVEAMWVIATGKRETRSEQCMRFVDAIEYAARLVTPQGVRLSPERAAEYAREVLRARFPELEHRVSDGQLQRAIGADRVRGPGAKKWQVMAEILHELELKPEQDLVRARKRWRRQDRPPKTA